MSNAILALLGVISTAEALKLQATQSDLSESSLTCHYDLDRLAKGDGGHWDNHPHGVQFEDPDFPAAQSSLFWNKYKGSGVRSTH